LVCVCNNACFACIRSEQVDVSREVTVINLQQFDPCVQRCTDALTSKTNMLCCAVLCCAVLCCAACGYAVQCTAVPKSFCFAQYHHKRMLHPLHVLLILYACTASAVLHTPQPTQALTNKPCQGRIEHPCSPTTPPQLWLGFCQTWGSGSRLRRLGLRRRRGWLGLGHRDRNRGWHRWGAWRRLRWLCFRLWLRLRLRLRLRWRWGWRCCGWRWLCVRLRLRL
jgi:hypothetical protein